MLAQTKALKTGFITYLLQKQAAGIIDMTVAAVGGVTGRGEGRRGRVLFSASPYFCVAIIVQSLMILHNNSNTKVGAGT